MSINLLKHNKKSIAIMISAKNGDLFIQKQLKSIITQTHTNIDIYISDNNSYDQTIQKINNFIHHHKLKNIFLLDGHDLHFGNNFVILAQTISKKYDYYAFCDQDDVWNPDHTVRAIEAIENTSRTHPTLFCSRTLLVNDADKDIGSSKFFKKGATFKNALVQSIAGGNTMVFNYKAYELLLEIEARKSYITSHDWLMYLLVSGHQDGLVIYSSIASVKYRQHRNNLIGSNNGFINKLKRAKYIFRGDWSHWLDENYNILNNHSCLSKDNKILLSKFHELRKSNRFFSLLKFYRLGLYRQTTFGNISMIIALVFKKF